MKQMMIFISICLVSILLIGAMLYFTNNGYSKIPVESGSTKTMTDSEGNVYNIVQVGNQVWMAENLRTLTYNDGSKIDDCYYYNNDTLNSKLFGVLYSGKVIDNANKLCPKGWRIPRDEDYKTLETFLGMDTSELDKTGWRPSNGVATKLKANDKGFLSLNKESNLSKFNALPSGVRTPQGKFMGLYTYSDHWTQTEVDGQLINRSMTWFTLHPGKNKIYRKRISKDWYFSIRLIKE